TLPARTLNRLPPIAMARMPAVPPPRRTAAHSTAQTRRFRANQAESDVNSGGQDHIVQPLGQEGNPLERMLPLPITGRARQSDAQSQRQCGSGIRNLLPLAIVRSGLGRITTMLTRRGVPALLMATGFGLLATAPAAAEPYPNRVIKMIV